MDGVRFCLHESPIAAAMEPGLGDREWRDTPLPRPVRIRAAMEPGLGDREWPR